MNVNEVISKLPESELLYIGFRTGDGFAYILRKRDINLDEIDAQMDKHIKQSYRKNYLILQGEKDRAKAYNKASEKQAEIEGKLEEIKRYMGVPFSKREVLDVYARTEDVDAVGTAVIVDGCEKPRGKWFMDDNGGGNDDN